MIKNTLQDYFHAALEAHPDKSFHAEATAAVLAQKALSILTETKGVAAVRVEALSLEQEDGTPVERTYVMALTLNKPFVFDSLLGALRASDYRPLIRLHPIWDIAKDEQGAITYMRQKSPLHFQQSTTTISDRPLESALNTTEKTTEYSLIVFVLATPLDQAAATVLEAQMMATLDAVTAAVRDWGAIREKVTRIEHYIQFPSLSLSAEDRSEILSFLQWINDHHFTFLGYRYCAYPEQTNAIASMSHGLGILSAPHRVLCGSSKDVPMPTASNLQALTLDDILAITKTTAQSIVHRTVPMDMIRIAAYSEEGALQGEHQFVGLFTSTAYARSAREIPLIRLKAHRVLKKAGFRYNWHDGKALAHIIETLPRDELFQYSDEELFRISMGLVHVQAQERTAVFVRQAPFGHFATALVYIPRDHYGGTALRLKIQKKLEEVCDGVVREWQSEMGSLPFVRLYFILTLTPSKQKTTISPIAISQLEQDVQMMSQRWPDQVKQALSETCSGEEAQRLAEAYGTVFPIAYQDACSPQEAVEDIMYIEQHFTPTTTFSVHLGYKDAHHQALYLKIYSLENGISLADIFPKMTHMGLKALVEQTFALEWRNKILWVHEFKIDTSGLDPEKILDRHANFEDCLTEIWQGRVEDDRFNALVLSAGVAWRDIIVLRALSKYLRQLQPTMSLEGIQRTLEHHPEIGLSLVELFKLRMDPHQHKESLLTPSQQTSDNHVRHILGALDKVKSLEEDRILRALLNLITAMVRTNYFQPAEQGGTKDYVAFKFDCSLIGDMPLPRPVFEVFVYSPWMEGIHLRGSRVARGGIRWSDRPEDFRTEILGLVKAQMVKNAVIVPGGAKGGFIIKACTHGWNRDALQAEGIRCYQTLIQGLLDITDNLVGGKVQHPATCVLYDTQDPYLVVAADKGTATFSDIANALAQQYNFWLGDGFASGGSSGYDHKKMAITARGAWIAVERHFREMGIDCQTQPFTVVGVGDMSGDVFGNAMMLSGQIKLVAAFNHAHIFIDPTPDPTPSFKERQRLFTLPRSSWLDYDPKVLSKGGGVFDRHEKSLTLTTQMMTLLATSTATMTPDELIMMLLKLPADLLWFGGIGTYIKARHESHQDVGDKANNAVRINGADLRCKVVGEGANLGVTQQGRIEFAANKGRINTDAIDNSAGVDCSDHEVNIKIITQTLLSSKKLTYDQRNALLTAMTDTVADLVLRDNYQQTQAISVMNFQGFKILDHQERLIKHLERDGKLNRAMEYLPNDDVLAERHINKIGLYRPEIAVLMAYAKIWIKETLISHDTFDEPLYEHILLSYFPGPMIDMYADELRHHPLKKELIATYLSNQVVQRGGMSLVVDMLESSSAMMPEIVHAFVVVVAIFDLEQIWSSIEALDNKVPARLQLQLLDRVGIFLKRTILWFLRHGETPMIMNREIAKFHPAIQEMAQFLPKLITPNDLTKRQQRAKEYIDAGVPAHLATTVVNLTLMAFGCRIHKIAETTDVPLTYAAGIFFALTDALGLHWLLEIGTRMVTESYWDKLSQGSILDDLTTTQGDLAEIMIKSLKSKANWATTSPETLVACWLVDHQAMFVNFKQLMTDLKASPHVDMSMLNVASRQFRRALRRI